MTSCSVAKILWRRQAHDLALNHVCWTSALLPHGPIKTCHRTNRTAKLRALFSFFLPPFELLALPDITNLHLLLLICLMKQQTVETILKVYHCLGLLWNLSTSDQFLETPLARHNRVVSSVRQDGDQWAAVECQSEIRGRCEHPLRDILLNTTSKVVEVPASTRVWLGQKLSEVWVSHWMWTLPTEGLTNEYVQQKEW